MPHLVLNGRRIEYAWHGPGPAAAPTLVFLHAGLGCAASWETFPAEVADLTGTGALVYSRPGYGGSDPVPLPRPLTYMHDEARDVLPGVLAATRVRDVILVGHSDGGSIALLHAGGARPHPGLRALALLAPHVFCEEVTVRGVAAQVAAYATGDLRACVARWHGANADVAFRGWSGAWLDPGFRAWNIEASLPRIRVPTLVLQGAEDDYGTLAQVEAIARGTRGPVTRQILSPCGHAPQRDQPDATRAALVAFVRTHLARR